MGFDERAELDTSQVEDARGSSGGGGFSIPGGGKTIGGGLVGLLLVVIIGFLGANGLPVDLTESSAPADSQGLAQKCARANPDRFKEADCRQVATVNDLQDYWSQALFPLWARSTARPGSGSSAAR